MYKSIIALYMRESTNFYLRRVGGLKGRREIYSWKKREKELLSIVKYKIYFFVDNEYPYCFYKCEILYVKKGGGTMKKRLVGAVTLITAVAGVIYMKNNPKYKEIVQKVKNADARGLYEKIILEKDKLAFTSKAKIKDYKVDYESIRNMGEKIFARLIINNNEKANIEILMSDDAQQVEEVGHSKEVDKILESNEE